MLSGRKLLLLLPVSNSMQGKHQRRLNLSHVLVLEGEFDSYIWRIHATTESITGEYHQCGGFNVKQEVSGAFLFFLLKC
jgi:hypothetical protein